MPHENKFSGQAHAENKLSVQTKFDSHTPPLQNQIVAPLHCVQRSQSITDKLYVAHCALFVAPFTTSPFKCLCLWYMKIEQLNKDEHDYTNCYA